MSIIKYTAFVKIVELGSYSAAAKALGYTPPGIHHMITSLEQELGNPLLDSDGKKIITTPFGDSILHHAYQITKSAEFIKNTAKMIPADKPLLNIGSYHSMLINLVPEILNNFSNRFPDVTINITELLFSICPEIVADREVDLCFMTDDCPVGYEFTPLIKDPSLAIMQKSHPLTAYDKIPIDALADYSIVRYVPGSDDVYSSVMRNADFQSNYRYATNSDTPTMELVRSTGAVALLSSLELARLTNDLTYRYFEGNPNRILGIVSKTSKLSNPFLKDFIDVSKETAKSFCIKNGLEPLC